MERAEETSGVSQEAAVPVERLLVKPREAAVMLAISARKLWELTNIGEIPVVRIGRSLRYSRADLEGWVASSRSRGRS
jgi:excisionase family DNA binding protein